MPRSSGDVRLANRLHVLQLRQLNPELGVMELARRAQLNESTVRYILKVYGKPDISLGLHAFFILSPSPRSFICVFQDFYMINFQKNLGQSARSI